jgi:hypothetical protein
MYTRADRDWPPRPALVALKTFLTMEQGLEPDYTAAVSTIRQYVAWARAEKTKLN